MGNMKCPFCQQELRKLFNRYTGEPNCDYECGNCDCDLYGIEMPETVWQALIQAKQDLEQSEKCCSAWETQALDYKVETIALSGKLEIARKAFENIDMLLHSRKFDITELGRLNIIQHLVSRALKATEHKE